MCDLEERKDDIASRTKQIHGSCRPPANGMFLFLSMLVALGTETRLKGEPWELPGDRQEKGIAVTESGALCM